MINQSRLPLLNSMIEEICTGADYTDEFSKKLTIKVRGVTCSMLEFTNIIDYSDMNEYDENEEWDDLHPQPFSIAILKVGIYIVCEGLADEFDIPISEKDFNNLEKRIYAVYASWKNNLGEHFPDLRRS